MRGPSLPCSVCTLERLQLWLPQAGSFADWLISFHFATDLLGLTSVPGPVLGTDHLSVLTLSAPCPGPTWPVDGTASSWLWPSKGRLGSPALSRPGAPLGPDLWDMLSRSPGSSVVSPWCRSRHLSLSLLFDHVSESASTCRKEQCGYELLVM